MAKIFLNTNIFIDAIHRKPESNILDLLENHLAFISPLSLHIYCYTYKIKTPDKKVNKQREAFQIIELTEDILDKALVGPLSDCEDNIQLHSAAEGECDYFITNDKKLLAMKFFGKTTITSPEEFKLTR